jgi:hypothetical protein
MYVYIIFDPGNVGISSSSDPFWYMNVMTGHGVGPTNECQGADVDWFQKSHIGRMNTQQSYSNTDMS